MHFETRTPANAIVVPFREGLRDDPRRRAGRMQLPQLVRDDRHPNQPPRPSDATLGQSRLGVAQSGLVTYLASGLAAAAGISPELLDVLRDCDNRRSSAKQSPSGGTSEPERIWTSRECEDAESLHGVSERLRPIRSCSSLGVLARPSLLAWISPLASLPRALWLWVLRDRELRRIRAAWDFVDDRTLNDIGISRHEVGLLGGTRRRY